MIDKDHGILSDASAEGPPLRHSELGVHPELVLGVKR